MLCGNVSTVYALSISFSLSLPLPLPLSLSHTHTHSLSLFCSLSSSLTISFTVFLFSPLVDRDGVASGRSAHKWTHLRKRSLQNWGGSPSSCGMACEPLPRWLAAVCQLLVDAAVFDRHAPPNHVLLNRYLPGQVRPFSCSRAYPLSPFLFLFTVRVIAYPLVIPCNSYFPAQPPAVSLSLSLYYCSVYTLAFMCAPPPSLSSQGIMPHTDGPLYLARVPIISLGSSTVLNFFRTLADTKSA